MRTESLQHMDEDSIDLESLPTSIDLRNSKNIKHKKSDIKKDIHELPDEINPFPIFGAWVPSHVHKLNAEIPASMIGTTNDLTRKDRPTTRFWKTPIRFRYLFYSNTEIKVNEIKIPFCSGKEYGKDYIYMCLPIEFENLLSSAAEGICKLEIKDKEIRSSNDWWKTANCKDGELADKFGIVHPVTENFMPRDLKEILDKSKKGIVANIILKFWCSASTKRRQALTLNHVRTVGIDVIRAYLTKINQDVSGPPTDHEVAYADLADRTLLKDLAKLKLI